MSMTPIPSAGRISKVSNGLLRSLECAYESGVLDPLKDSLLPFIRANRCKLLDFISSFQQIEGGEGSLEQMIKIFIIQNNMPFDMGFYMSQQTNVIRREACCEDTEQDRRQENVAQWIRERAQSHRSFSMFQQVYCFERIKHEVLPLIRDELGLPEDF